MDIEAMLAKVRKEKAEDEEWENWQPTPTAEVLAARVRGMVAAKEDSFGNPLLEEDDDDADFEDDDEDELTPALELMYQASSAIKAILWLDGQKNFMAAQPFLQLARLDTELDEHLDMYDNVDKVQGLKLFNLLTAEEEE